MKVLVVFLSFYLMVQSKPVSLDEIKSISKTCIQKSNMDVETLKRIGSARSFPKPTKEYLNFLECSYSKQGYLDNDGLISYSTIEDFILDYYDKETVKLAIEPCVVDQTGENGAERAYNTAKCLITNLELLEQKYNNEIIENTTLNSFYN
nr:uncharacterized protein LOC111422324 [Onthophagus taurus]